MAARQRPLVSLITDWDQQRELRRILTAKRSSQRDVFRARIILGWARGLRHEEISREQGVSLLAIGRWRKRWVGPVAFGINDPGQVVGTYVDANGDRHGFLLSKGMYTKLDVPDAAFTVAQGINNAGQIVGLYVDGDDNQHGFVLSKGVYTTIDVPNSTATAVFSINAQGAIVGSYDDAAGAAHGYVGTPAR